MEIRKLINRELISCPKDTTIYEVSQLMAEYDIGGVVVIHENKEPIGFITDRDIVVRLLAKNGDPNNVVEDIMTRRCITIKEWAKCDEALRVMGYAQVRRVIVVNDDNQAIGVVSLRDLSLYNKTNNRVKQTLKNISRESTQKNRIQDAIRVDDYPL